MSWSRETGEYEILVCGYTSDSEGKNQAEWYAIKVPNPNPDPDPPRYRHFGFGDRKIYLPSSAKEKEKEKISPPSAKANVKVTIETEPLHPFSVVRMMYQSTQHAVLKLPPPIYVVGGLPDRTYLFSLGGLDPVGSDSDGDGAQVCRFDVNKPDAGWKAVPLMTFPKRYNPPSVTLRGKLYVLGGFSRSQFPAEAAAKGDGWMEVYGSQGLYSVGWKSLHNPPSGFSFNDDPLIFTALDAKGEILVAQYNHDDMNCDSATFYVYDVNKQRWTTLEPPVRKLLARYPDRTGRRSLAVGNTLYWGLFEDEDINVQAYDLDKDIWFHGSFNIRPVLGKDEFLADNVFPASPPLLHLANQKFCLFLLTSIYDEKNCEVSNLYLNCLILDVSPINDEGDNHQHDYYDHVCYKVRGDVNVDDDKVRGDVNVDDEEDNANYHVYPHDHFWRLSISVVSIHKHPLVNPIQLLDAVHLLGEQNSVVSSIGTMSSSKKITLKSSDGEAFEVEEAVALQSQTIKHIIEDNCADNGIPLPNVTSKILAMVIEYCKKHVESTSADVRTSDLDLRIWDTKFVMVDQETVQDLMMAANYLNIKSLLGLTALYLADLIRGKVPKRFISPEEEEEIMSS